MQELILDDLKKEVYKSKKPVLLWFSAYWCSACFLSKQDIELFAEDNKNVLKTFKVDVDKQEELSLRFEVKNLPTFVLIEKGKVVMKKEGALNKQQLETEILTKITQKK